MHIISREQLISEPSELKHEVPSMHRYRYMSNQICPSCIVSSQIGMQSETVLRIDAKTEFYFVSEPDLE